MVKRLYGLALCKKQLWCAITLGSIHTRVYVTACVTQLLGQPFLCWYEIDQCVGW